MFYAHEMDLGQRKVQGKATNLFLIVMVYEEDHHPPNDGCSTTLPRLAMHSR